MRHYFILSFLLFSSVVLAEPTIIYGEDNRLDTIDSPVPLFRRLAKSTVAMIKKERLSIKGSTAELHGPSLGEFFELCEKEKFHSQPSVASCSGFLVAPDLVVTAGHCIRREEDCESNAWVFNYRLSWPGQTSLSLDAEDVFHCQSIVKQEFSNVTSMDYALIKLDRPVTAYAPVKLATQEVEIGTPLVMIGHPSGLPQKIADGARVISKYTNGFYANLDAFQINSGSAVFNANTGDLVGILVNGQKDYRMNTQLNCKEVNEMADTQGKEGVSSFKQFSGLIQN